MTPKPNLVYILNDHHAYYGHGEMVDGPEIKRPNFNRLASEGVKFTRAYTACPLCGPARRTMLTGLFPHNHGEIKNETNHKYDRELYLERLNKEDYELFYFGKWHAGRGTALDFGCKGFSAPGYGNPYITAEYKQYLKENNLPQFQVKVKHSFFDPDDHYTKMLDVFEGKLHTPTFLSCSEHSTGIMRTPKETHEAFFLANRACEQLKEYAESGSNKPFHLRVDFWGPHQPYYTSQEYLDLYDPKDIKELPSFSDDLSDKPEIYKVDLNYRISKDTKLIIPNPVPWSTWQEVLAYNYAQQTLIDDAMGMILDTLEELGFVDDTLLICTSDHGDSVASHGGHFDKDAFMPEEMIRIPFVVRYPDNIPSGVISEKLVNNIDVAPTLLAAAGTEFSEPVDGRNLLDIFSEEDGNWREDVMCETHGHFTRHLGRALITERYKYVFNEGDLDELYDLEADPFELSNLISNADYNEVLSDMKTRLLKWRNQSNDDITKAMIKGKRLRK